MRICQIGVIGYKSIDKKKEIKNIGGIGGYILDLTDILCAYKISIDFVGKIFFYHKRVNINYYQVQNKLTSTSKFLFHLFLKSFFIKLPKDVLIHAHRPDHLAVFTFFKKNKSVVTLHGQQAVTVYKRKNWMIRKIYKYLEIIALKKVSKILVTDKITKDYYSRQYPEHSSKIVITPTGVDLNKFKKLDKFECREKNNYKPKDRIIQYLGRIEPPKKVEELIRAFSIISAEDENLKLMIIGDGLDLERMKSLAKELGLKDSVNFFGAIMRDYLPELINCADVSVLYSGNEGSPLSVKESLACGVPVVANDVGDISDIIKDGINGYIIKEETIEGLGRAILKCLDIANELSNNCANSILPYSKDIVYQQIMKIYKQILES